MSSIKPYLSSTIGKKVLVAVTGILFCLFLLFHLTNNLIIYTNKTNMFNLGKKYDFTQSEKKWQDFW